MPTETSVPAVTDTSLPPATNTPLPPTATTVPLTPTPMPPTNTPIPPASNVIGTDCSIGKPLPHHPPIVGQVWILPSGGWIIVNFWSNEPGVDQAEHKILLDPISPRAFLGGGSAWQWADECETVARQNLQTNPLPEITLDELKSIGLVR